MQQFILNRHPELYIEKLLHVKALLYTFVNRYKENDKVLCVPMSIHLSKKKYSPKNWFDEFRVSVNIFT